ncbi:MAG: hypothetical protein O3C27_04295 [Actinomycetota bacterium]|nr:hypothetical protein [Actinomycetota bacterium]
MIEPVNSTSTNSLVNWVEAEAATTLFDNGDASLVSSRTQRSTGGTEEFVEESASLGAPGGSIDRVV